MTTLETPLLDLTAKDLMSQEVLLIPQHMSLRAAAHRLAQVRVGGAPVVDAEGRCVGVLSAADLVHWVDRGERAPAARGEEACVCCDWQLDRRDDIPEDEVSHCMTRDVVSAGTNARLGELARWMRDAGVHRIIILDEERRPVGVVSSMDVLAAVARLEAVWGIEGP